MDEQALVSRTPKGEEAIEQRRHELDRNLRYVLILVDGKSTVEQLRAKGSGLPDVEGSLRQLAADGFVRVGKGEEGTDGADIAAVKGRLIEIAQEVLGADAKKVISKLEAAPASRAGLLEVTSGCKKMVRLIIDEDKADELMDRCGKILDTL